MTELKWLASSSASALYAAATLTAGQPVVDPRLALAIAPPAALLAAVLRAAALAPDAFFRHAVPLAAGIENNRELAGLSLRKALGLQPSEGLVSRLSAAIAAVEAAFRRELPGAVDELELRSGPLREQWEARGPGLLAATGRSTDPALIVERAEVLLLQPVLGGGGEAYLPYNVVSIEAVLANPHAALPEVVRLAWLISTLHTDLHRFSEGIAPARLPWLAGMAMLPAALEAAEYVELAKNDPPTLRLALAVWGLGTAADADRAETLASTLEDWWRTFGETRPAWGVALAALDRMLDASQL